MWIIKKSLKMKKTKKNTSLILALILFVFGCVESITDNPNNVPDIEIYSPVTNDTVHVGRNLINYTAQDYVGGQGIDHFDIVLNDDYEHPTTFTKKVKGETPLYLDIPDALLNSNISYFVNVYNKEGKVTSSKKQINLYVDENKNPPDTPDTLTIQRTTTTEVVLFWKDKSNNEEGFEIYRKDGENGTYRPINTVPTNTISYTDRFLSAYINYYYKVRAYNQYGQSYFTNEVNSAQAGGNEPYGLTAEAKGAKWVYLTWQNMTYIATALKIQRKSSSATFWTDIKTLPPETKEYYDNKNLYPQTAYDYRVGALILNNWVYSNQVSVITYQTDVPAPKDLEATFNPATNKVEIRWGEYPNYATGTVIEKKKGYNGIYYKVGETGTDATFLIDDNIEANNIYFYRAKYSTTENYYTIFSKEDSAAVPIFRPTAPANLKISKFSGANTFLLEWEDKSNDETGFEIYYKKEGEPTYKSFTGNPLPAGTIAQQVTPPTNEVYYYIVKSVRGNLRSMPSNEVSTLLGDGTFNLFKASARKISSTTYVIDLQWTAAQAGVIGYKVERSYIWPVKFEEVVTLTPGTTSYTDTSVSAGKDYIYRISAVYANGKLFTNEKSVGTY